MTGIEVGVAIIIGILLGRFLPARRKGPCKRYSGPLPLPEYTANEIASGG